MRPHLQEEQEKKGKIAKTSQYTNSGNCTLYIYRARITAGSSFTDQVGHIDVSFTTPEANMSRNSSHFISHSAALSWALGSGLREDEKSMKGEGEREVAYFFQNLKLSGATSIVRNPVSRRRVSLQLNQTTRHGIIQIGMTHRCD